MVGFEPTSGEFFAPQLYQAELHIILLHHVSHYRPTSIPCQPILSNSIKNILALGVGFEPTLSGFVRHIHQSSYLTTLFLIVVNLYINSSAGNCQSPDRNTFFLHHVSHYRHFLNSVNLFSIKNPSF